MKSFISITNYILLMAMGTFLFLFFLIVGIFFALGSESLMTKVIEFLNNLLGNTDGENSIVLPNNWNWFLAIPFFIFSIFGLSILLLTQRTTNSNRKLKRTLNEVYNSEYSELNQEELREVLDKYEIKYKEKWSRSTLLHLVDKKVDKIRKYVLKHKEK